MGMVNFFDENVLVANECVASKLRSRKVGVICKLNIEKWVILTMFWDVELRLELYYFRGDYMSHDRGLWNGVNQVSEDFSTAKKECARLGDGVVDRFALLSFWGLGFFLRCGGLAASSFMELVFHKDVVGFMLWWWGGTVGKQGQMGWWANSLNVVSLTIAPRSGRQIECLGHETYEHGANGGGMGGGQWGPDFNPFTDIFNTDNVKEWWRILLEVVEVFMERLHPKLPQKQHYHRHCMTMPYAPDSSSAHRGMGGKDVKVSVELSFMEAVQGCTKTLTFQTDLPCEACGMAVFSELDVSAIMFLCQ
ncbi:hypothetical protein CsSME_00011794 [Camellia sinensis var. sinensis]